MDVVLEDSHAVVMCAGRNEEIGRRNCLPDLACCLGELACGPPNLGGNLKVWKLTLQIPNDAFFMLASRSIPQFEADHCA
jgi:hypothetical protein